MNGCSDLLLCLVGPAGSGKTSIADLLLKRFPDSIELSVSFTSRTPRPGETPGVSYNFITREQFEGMAKAGKFFEWEETHGNYYGTAKDILDSRAGRKQHVLFDIDIRGALNLKRAFPERCIVIFIIPPGWDELLARLKNRAGSSEDDLRRRIATTEQELKQVLDLHEKGEGIDYIVVNDRLESCATAVTSIFEAEQLRFARISRERLSKIFNLRKL